MIPGTPFPCAKQLMWHIRNMRSPLALYHLHFLTTRSAHMDTEPSTFETLAFKSKSERHGPPNYNYSIDALPLPRSTQQSIRYHISSKRQVADVGFLGPDNMEGTPVTSWLRPVCLPPSRRRRNILKHKDGPAQEDTALTPGACCDCFRQIREDERAC